MLPLLYTGGSCLKAGHHFIFVTIYLLLLINCIVLDSVSKILFNFFLLPIIIIIMILIMKILLHNEYKIINLWYPTYVYQFLNFLYNNRINFIITRPILDTNNNTNNPIGSCCRNFLFFWHLPDGDKLI